MMNYKQKFALLLAINTSLVLSCSDNAKNPAPYKAQPATNSSSNANVAQQTTTPYVSPTITSVTTNTYTEPPLDAGNILTLGLIPGAISLVGDLISGYPPDIANAASTAAQGMLSGVQINQQYQQSQGYPYQQSQGVYSGQGVGYNQQYQQQQSGYGNVYGYGANSDYGQMY